MPLGHLIALISNAHPSPTRFHIPGERRFDEPSFRQSGVHCSERPEVNQNKPEFQPDACAPARTPPRPPCGGTLSGTQTSTFAPRLIPSSRCQVNRHRVIGPRAGSCCFFEHRCRPRRSDCTRDAGGARRDRTDDLKLAKLALSQLSYGPVPSSRHLRPLSCRTASAVPTAATKQEFGWPEWTRTTDLTLIRRVL